MWYLISSAVHNSRILLADDDADGCDCDYKVVASIVCSSWPEIPEAADSSEIWSLDISKFKWLVDIVNQ